MPEDQEAKSKSKHRKSTCSGCRRRKSKCDGKMPKCTTCIAYKDDCHYDKPPSLAYVRSLEEEIQELKQHLRQAKTQAWLTKTSPDEERKPSPASPQSDILSHQSIAESSLTHRSSKQVKWDNDISMDDQGVVAFHNSTSAVHEPPPGRDGRPPMPLARALLMASGSDHENAKRELVMNANATRQWEDYAIANTAVKANVSKEVSDELLKYHWCWIHPLFLMVYRPAFTRGMAMVDSSSLDSPDPPYFSETLLKVIHAHCARFLNHPVHQHLYQTLPSQQAPVPVTLVASEFMQKLTEEARLNLGFETQRQSSIPTIQALLQQSAREIVFGRSSQAWLYSGMAFRMAFDMGIHLPSDKLQSFVKTLTPEDIEVRKRLFWSCYTWDKIISLYLGRMPAFTPSTDEVPLTFMDDYSDTDLWSPYYGQTPDHSVPKPDYKPCMGYVVSCFRHLCTLCIILNDLMQHIYSSTASAQRNMEQADANASAELRAANEAPFIRIARDLNQWWISLPSHLRIPPESPPPLAPPIHIMSLNLTYHTTLILLHRPVILGSSGSAHDGAQQSYSICLSATAAIHDLLGLQARTFGLSHISYLNAYAAYIAATVAVLRFERDSKPGEENTATTENLGLNFLLGVLQKSADAMPALQRSVAIIRKRMKAVLDRQVKSQLNTLFPSSSTPTSFNLAATQEQMDLAQPTVFQAISNPALVVPYANNQEQGEASNFVQTAQSMPMSWPSNMRSSIYSDHSFADDFLPAFPGQQFPVGSEHSFGSNDVDPSSRAALMGFNLDPHPRLNHGDLNWNAYDAFSNEQPM